VTHDTRIGECETCQARFKVPASFRADRARCRECGGVVVLEAAHPVPRPPLEKSRKSKPQDRGEQRAHEPAPAHAAPTASPRAELRDAEHSERRAAEPMTSAAHHSARAPADRAQSAHADEKRDPPPPKDARKSGGVLGSIVAAAKAAVWRKKRGK
jgi:hypothetical protein